MAALADGESLLRGPLIADDTQQMFAALETLGVHVEHFEGDVRVTGHGGRLPDSRDGVTRLHLGNAGTAYRFLTAACCLNTPGSDPTPHIYELDGITRMRERPIGQLVDAITQLGGRIEYLSQHGYPPLRITGTGLRGGELEMPLTLSSQYISALLQIGPLCEQGLTIRFQGPVTSRPYVEMTLRLMARFGVQAQVDPQFTQIRIEPGGYTATDYDIEPDASNASYFLAAAAIVGASQCTIQGLGKRSLQGDVGFGDLLHQMGAALLFGDDFITVMSPPDGQTLRGIDVDLNPMPDMAQTLAIVALFAQGDTTMRNIGNLRVKETNRLAAMKNELTKLGATVVIEDDDMTITPPVPPPQTPGDPIKIEPGTSIDTYNDHRMAMSFALVGLKTPGLVINDPGCVDKTFPDYFEYLSKLDRSE